MSNKNLLCLRNRWGGGGGGGGAGVTGAPNIKVMEMLGGKFKLNL